MAKDTRRKVTIELTAEERKMVRAFRRGSKEFTAFGRVSTKVSRTWERSGQVP